MGKTFTLQEAAQLIPKLSEWLREAIEAKSEAAKIEGELRALAARINALGGVEIDPAAVGQRKRTHQRAAQRLRRVLGAIEESGCLVKDLDVGLIDFPARLGAEEVYLCWKLGETRIDYWHRPDEGFTGRKRIRNEFGERSDPPRAQ